MVRVVGGYWHADKTETGIHGIGKDGREDGCGAVGNNRIGETIEKGNRTHYPRVDNACAQTQARNKAGKDGQKQTKASQKQARLWRKVPKPPRLCTKVGPRKVGKKRLRKHTTN